MSPSASHTGIARLAVIVGLGAAVIAGRGAAAVAGARPAALQPAPFAVVVAPPASGEATLATLGAQGYRCAALARPEPDVRLGDVVAVLERVSPDTSPVEHRVVSGDARFSRAHFEEALNAAGAEGFRDCGLTRVTPANRRDGGPHAVVMSRVTGAPGPAREYRVIYTAGAGTDWRRVEQALQDGFTITRAVWAAPPGAGTVPEVGFLAERDPAVPATPADHVLESDATAPGLARRLAARALAGYRVEAAWASPAAVVALMTRRPGSQDTRPDYDVAASSTGSFSPPLSSGRLLASIPFRGVRFAIRDVARPGDYATAEREHPSFDTLFTARDSEARALADRLAAAPSGVHTVDVVVRTIGRGRLRTEAILERRRRE